MSSPIVNLTPTASVKGKCVHPIESIRPNGVYTFLGVPYAASPTGKLRFQNPQPVQLWQGVRDCVEFGAVCPQNVDGIKRFIDCPEPPKMDEDCLFLNVYTPTVHKKAKFPVMFWIHGGGFMSGYSNDFEGTSLCNFNDVVVVSINYRLGLFGFSVTGDIVKGNMGLFDQLEALKWVQKYIVNFGGDPDNVTIFGESAGGMSSCFHILSPHGKGLFRRAICESGANAYFGVAWPKKNALKSVGKKLQGLGLKDASDEKRIVEFMKTLSTAELICGVNESYMPIIDGYYLPDAPTELYQQGKFNKDVDVIMGYNEHEGSLFVFRMLDKTLPKTMRDAKVLLDIIVDVRFLRGVNNADLVKKAIIDEYMRNVQDGDENGYLRAIIEIYGDLLFVAPALYCAQQHSKQGNGQTYVYEFTHKTPEFPYKQPWIGADHLEEIPYVLGKPFQQKYTNNWRKVDYEFSKDVMALWANFAKNGNPNGAILKEWPKYSNANKDYMILNPKFEVAWDHKPRRMKLWNEDIPRIISRPKSKY